MDYPKHQINKTLMSAVVMTGDLNSDAININEVSNFAIQGFYSAFGGVQSAVLNIQASCDGTNFVTINSTSITTASGSFIYNASNVGYSHVRANFDWSTGTGGSLTVILNAKR